MTIPEPSLRPGLVEPELGVVSRSGIPVPSSVGPDSVDTERIGRPGEYPCTRGSFPDGREFDSSYSRGQPASFPLNRVIKCWTEGVQMMKVGGKAQLTCPPAIAYGEQGQGPIPGKSVLEFEVELVEISKAK